MGKVLSYCAIVGVGLCLLALIVASLSRPKNTVTTASQQMGNEQPINYQVTEPLVIPKQNRKITIIAVGDIMLGRTVMTAVNNSGDVNYPFIKTADVLKSGDITFGNLENPIVNNCPKSDSGFTFCTDPKLVAGLVFSGFDVVTLANNHMFNFGTKGLENTRAILSANTIGYVGYGDGVIREIKGVRIGFVGVDFVTSAPRQADYDYIANYAQNCDVLVVGVHWGVEYTTQPTALQVEWAGKLVDAGADIVIGSHPHWVQSKAEIQGKPVYWSLGNFVFDQMWSEETKKGVIVKITLDGDRIVDDELINTYIRKIGQPEIVE